MKKEEIGLHMYLEFSGVNGGNFVSFNESEEGFCFKAGNVVLQINSERISLNDVSLSPGEAEEHFDFMRLGSGCGAWGNLIGKILSRADELYRQAED